MPNPLRLYKPTVEHLSQRSLQVFFGCGEFWAVCLATGWSQVVVTQIQVVQCDLDAVAKLSKVFLWPTTSKIHAFFGHNLIMSWIFFWDAWWSMITDHSSWGLHVSTKSLKSLELVPRLEPHPCHPVGSRPGPDPTKDLPDLRIQKNQNFRPEKAGLKYSNYSR